MKGRKPRSLGRAPTKLELVDPDPTLDDEEEKLMAEWKKQYEASRGGYRFLTVQVFVQKNS